MRVPLLTVLREWGRIGVIGFGGPPAHIALVRRLVVERRGWMDAEEFEAAIAACNLLPGPASTQLAIFCAYRVAGRRGAPVGGWQIPVLAGAAVALLLARRGVVFTLLTAGAIGTVAVLAGAPA